jgi:hypothetical protein
MARDKEMGDSVFDKMPDAVAVILPDINRIPLESAGEFDFDSYDLRAAATLCLESCRALGRDQGPA